MRFRIHYNGKTRRNLSSTDIRKILMGFNLTNAQAKAAVSDAIKVANGGYKTKYPRMDGKNLPRISTKIEKKVEANEAE